MSQINHQNPFRVSSLNALKKVGLTIFLFAFTLILLYINLEKSEHLQRKTRKFNTSEPTLYIENILDLKNEISMGDNIFFLDTTRMKNPNKIRDLTLRQACSIESASIANSNAKVFLTLVSPYSIVHEIRSPVMEAILSYPNIYVNSMNLIQFSIDSPYEHFIANGSLFKSKFVKQHTSDFIRLLFLIKYGGIYIDTDVIVMKNLQSLPTNFICRDHGFLNAAIIKLRNNLGKTLGKLFINDLIRNFNGSEWGWNGPYMLSRVLKDVCKTSNVNEMHNCNGFHVLDENICYPISGLNWNKLFDEQNADEVMHVVKQSHFIHFWNKLSQNEKLSCNSSAAYAQLARQFCPKTFSLCQNYF